MKRAVALAFLLLWGRLVLGQTPPKAPIDSVTVDAATGFPVISWHVESLENVEGFDIKRHLFGVSGTVDGEPYTVQSIEDAGLFSFTDNSQTYGPARPSARPEAYRVVAYRYDQNGEKVFGLQSDRHQSIWLRAEYATCPNTTSLAWTAYQGWPAQGYQVFHRAGAQEFSLLATTADTLFVHVAPGPNLPHEYFVRALSGQGASSSSNRAEVFSRQPVAPGLLGFDNATVEGQGVRLSARVEGGELLSEARLARSSDGGATWAVLARPPLGQASEHFDPEAELDSEQLYQLEVFDICGQSRGTSRMASSIVLEADKLDQGVALAWTGQRLWDEPQPGRLLRSNDDGPFEQVAEFADGRAATDQPPAEAGKLCYRLALDGPQGQASHSNDACLFFEAGVFVPNAFNPYSPLPIDREFRAFVAFAQDFSLRVIDAGGFELFSSQDPRQGWDGRKPDGSWAKEGVYIYLLSLTNSRGQTLARTGTVTLFFD